MKKQITKTLRVFCVILITLFLSISSNAQHWQTGVGNPIGGLDGVVPGTNFIGTALANPTPVNLGSNGATQMTLDVTGNVGIGIVVPNHLLDVHGGDINVGDASAPNSTVGYMIGDNYVLRHNGHPEDIFVGVNAGNATMTGHFNAFIGKNVGNLNSTGFENTFVGTNAGTANTVGYYNCYFGERAGTSNNGGGDNIFIGHMAGANGITGQQNILIGEQAGLVTNGQDNIMIGNYTGISQNVSNNMFIGSQAGYSNLTGIADQFIGGSSGNSNTTGSYNTFSGFSSGINNVDGNRNSFYGWDAGISNSSGSFNSFFGTWSGLSNTTGSANTFIGYNTDVPFAAVIGNSTVLGANAIVKTSNTMILGDNSVNVGVGLSGVTGGPLAKLHVQKDIAPPLLAVSNPTGIKTENNDVDVIGPFGGFAYGVQSQTLGPNRGNYGGWFRSERANNNQAGYFEALAANSGLSNFSNTGGNFLAGNGYQNYGIQSAAVNGTVSKAGQFYGGYAKATVGIECWALAGPTTATNYGTYSTATPLPGTVFNVAVYGNAPVNPVMPPPLPAPPTGTFAGYFNGDLGYTGGFWNMSDSTIKTDIKPLDSASSILSRINTYSYYFDTIQLQGSANVSHNLQFGFMAQQIEAIAPNLVLNTVIPPVLDSLGNIVIPARPVKMLNSLGIIPLLVQANKSLSTKDSTLEERVTALEQIVNTCCNLGHHSMGSPTQGQGSNESGDPQNTGSNNFPVKQAIDLASSDPILYQNQPNPFGHSTVIRYFIPENTSQPKIIFQDDTGRTINETVISQLGEGSIQVNSSLLNSGVYTYSLQIAGKIIDSKKMMKAK